MFMLRFKTLSARDLPVISPGFPLELTGFFQGKHFIHFLVLKMKDFRNFVLHNCILVFDAEQLYLKLQVTNLKNKEVTVNPKPQTLEKKLVFRKPIERCFIHPASPIGATKQVQLTQ